MNIKVIAIGNTLMEDDGAAIIVVEKIQKVLLKNNIEVINAETDFEYCISLIEENDFIIFLDAAYYNKVPGELTVIPIEKYNSKKKYYTQHSLSIIDLVKLYYKNVRGYIIGIEVAEVNFKLGLSRELKGKIDSISKNVLKEILLKACTN
ncbi:MAG: hydrogenase maturation protease [Clostridium sp.]|nr:hydrogenase maturation protease [Clostridium sp.]